MHGCYIIYNVIYTVLDYCLCDIITVKILKEHKSTGEKSFKALCDPEVKMQV